MADISRKRGDNYPALVMRLNQTVNNVVTPINLTTAVSVKFLMKAGAVTRSGFAAITDAVNGTVTYTWGATDLDTVGEFNAEFEITWPSSKVETVPSGPTAAAPTAPRYFTISVVEDLG